MKDTLSRVTTLLLATAVLLTGHGLQLTLLPVHALAAGWTGTEIGLTGSSYFLGFVVGCLIVPGIVVRVGHIRSFMVMAAGATVALLAAALLVNFGAWLVFRFATGLALSGLYMIVESWLAEVSPANRRGQVLSIYLAVSLLGMALGQVPVMVAEPGEIQLFVLAAILLSLAIIPVGLTRVASPQPIPAVRVTPGTLLRACRVAVVCAFLAGMVTGVFWTLGPVAGRSFGLDQGQVGLLMSMGVLGGAAAQYPIGRASDRFDRRVLIGVVMLSGAIVASLGALFADASTLALYAAIFLLCAVTMPVYALCIAQAADRTELTLVELTSGMLIAHGVGSIVGPILVAPPMSWLGPHLFFALSACFLLVGAVWSGYRHFMSDEPLVQDAHRPMVPKTTQAVAGLLEGGGDVAIEPGPGAREVG